MEKGNKRTYVSGKIDLSGFKMKDELNPKVWDGDKMKPEVRKALLKIADDYFEGLELGSEVDIEDITMTGSLANYNWSKYSDVDLPSKGYNEPKHAPSVAENKSWRKSSDNICVGDVFQPLVPSENHRS